MLRLALKMLFGDHAKYLMLISGITFATLLMTQGAALFCGIMSWTYSPMRNVRAHVWVTDPKVEQVNDSKPLRDTDIFRVKSVEGVAWAASLYLGNNQARLMDGSFKFVALVGLDSTTLAGAPTQIVQGRLEDLRLASYAPGQRKLLSFVLVEPVTGIAPADLARRIERETGLRAFTRDELMWS